MNAKLVHEPRASDRSARSQCRARLARRVLALSRLRATASLFCVLLGIAASTPAHAVLAPSYEWNISANLASGYWTSPWFTSGTLACPALASQIVGNDANMNAFLGYNPNNGYTFRNVVVVTGYSNTWPSYKCTVSWEYWSVSQNQWNSCQDCAIQQVGYRSNFVYAFVSATVGPRAQCGPQCNAVGPIVQTNTVSDPISPASGGVHEVETDLATTRTGLSFRRTYGSGDGGTTALSPGWRSSFTRSLRPVYASTKYKVWVSSPDNSSQYSDEAAACTSGFAQIKSRVAQWSAAIASYLNGVCTLSVGSTPIGTLPILYTAFPTPNPDTLTLVGYEVTRDDGQVINFQAGTTISAPAGIALKLQLSGSGFSLTDARDNVEYYDANGNLQTITSRNGVVQTASYDGAGRLSTVTDSFGQSFTLGYDGQGRLASLTDPASHTIQYSYDAQSRLSTVTQTDSTVRTYLYENLSFPYVLTGLIDESSTRMSTWGYDTAGRATSASGAGGADAVTLTYNADGSVTVTDALGAVRTFTFGRYGERNSVTGISGSQCPTCQEMQATTYDLAGFLSSRTDYNNNLTCYAYDDARGLELVRVEGFAPGSTCPSNLAAYTPAGGTRQRKISTTWHATYRLPSQIVEANRTTGFTFDAQGNVLTKTVTIRR